MTSTENLLGIIRDVILIQDVATRYDLYFTDKRIAIICLGDSGRVDHRAVARGALTIGLALTAVSMVDEKFRTIKRIDEEELDDLNIDEMLRLSKKSCFWTYEEIEKVKLTLTSKPKLIILSEEYESKFAPSIDQYNQLYNLLPSIDMLKSKLSIVTPKSRINTQGINTQTSFFCKYCGSKNDLDAIFCQRCGKQIQGAKAESQLQEITCASCGTKNHGSALFCKKCGKNLN
ncbi:MAG: zinc ribbon domain-containing protein [Candidatus Bathyarchaeota archaeon]|nr:zinc ribbon domain-containing protein [Candidatus Bathyarchaeota archaeon]